MTTIHDLRQENEKFSQVKQVYLAIPANFLLKVKKKQIKKFDRVNSKF